MIQDAGVAARSPNLDVLRATAVCMVVATHLIEATGRYSDAVIGLGHAGVMMFFVHTAFVLMQSLERLEQESHDRLVLRFYIRRLLRIYPLPSVVILSAVTIAKLFPIAVNPFFVLYMPTARQLLANLSLSQNLFHVQDIIVVLWSLPPEIQMYAVLPAFFALRASRPTSLILFWSGWVIMLTFLFETRIFDVIQYLPMFLPGIIAFQYSKRVEAKLPGWLWFASILLVVVPFILVGHKAVVVSWFTCLALGMTIPHFSPIRSKLAAVTAATVARYSYGIYLTHLGCIFAAAKLFSRYHRIGQFGGAVALIVLCALSLYHFVEKPFIDLGVRWAKRIGVSQPITVTASAAAG